MINVIKISQEKTTLDFSESFGPKASSVEVTRIYVNDNLLFTNAAEFLTSPLYDGSFLLDICEVCSCHGCNTPQGYVAIRKSNDMIIFLAAFSEAAEDSEVMDRMDGTGEDFLRGLCFSEDKYKTLCQIIPDLPVPQQILPLSNYEALCLFQAEAPYDVMGKFPCNPSLEKKLYLCSEDDNLPELLEKNIKKLIGAPASTALLKRIEQEPLSIYLDTLDLKQWPLMYKVKNSYHLRLKPNFYIVI